MYLFIYLFNSFFKFYQKVSFILKTLSFPTKSEKILKQTILNNFLILAHKKIDNLQHPDHMMCKLLLFYFSNIFFIILIYALLISIIKLIFLIFTIN